MAAPVAGGPGTGEAIVPTPTPDNSSAQRIVDTQVLDGRIVADISPGVTQ